MEHLKDQKFNYLWLLLNLELSLVLEEVLHLRLILGGDYLWCVAVDAVRIVSDSDEERGEKNR